MVACHDLQMALGPVEEAEAGGDPLAVVDVLIAAASGQSQAAYRFAADQRDDFHCALYLLAAAIGLRHGTLADDPGLPCATATVVGRLLSSLRDGIRVFPTTG